MVDTDTETVVRDSVYVTHEVIGTELLLRKADTSRLAVSLKRLTARPIAKRSDYARIIVQRIHDTIYAECTCDEYKEVIKQQKETIHRLTETITRQQTRETIVQHKIPPWIKPFVWMGVISLALIIGLIVLKIVIS